MRALRPLLVAAGLLLAWDLLVRLTGVPPFILPSPLAVRQALLGRAGLILPHAAVTASEILLGMLLGSLPASRWRCCWGFRGARPWVLPLLVVSQALPVFALAPLLVLWLGYGMASKVAMAVLIIFFPVTAAFYDGLRRTEAGWLELARTMGAGSQRCCGRSGCRRHCRRWPRGCGWRRRWPPSVR